MIGIVSLSSSSPLGDRRPRGSYQLWYDAPRNQEAMMKTTAETTSHRMAGEPLSSLQCHHGRYSSATSHHVVVWPYDHNYNHTQTCAARRHSLRAKLARSSLRLTTFKSGDLLLCMCPGPGLYIRAARAPILGIQLSFTYSYTVEGLLKLTFRQPVS
jgi:hypothetical protein